MVALLGIFALATGFLLGRRAAESVDISITAPGPDGWGTAPMDCDHCGHAWVSVYPLGTRELECPRCGNYTPAQEWGVGESPLKIGVN